MTNLNDRLMIVEERITVACRRAGRRRADVTLVVVTKSIGIEVARALPALGCNILGENRPQELWRKAAALPPTVEWHFIGHLQRNKIERTLPLVRLIHAVDSIRLLEALEQEAGRQTRVAPVLLEVNASRETSKQGFAPGEVPGLVSALRTLKNVRVEGLMTMAAPEEEAEKCRPTFATLRNLRDELRKHLAPAHPMRHLSMGMSNDFEIAIEEGATFIRVGSALFAGGEALVATAARD